MNHVVEVVVVYPVAYPVAMVVVAASDYISLHCVWHATETIRSFLFLVKSLNFVNQMK